MQVLCVNVIQEEKKNLILAEVQKQLDPIHQTHTVVIIMALDAGILLRQNIR